MTDKTPQDRIRDGLETAKTAAADAYATSRDKAGDAAHRAAEGIETNPLAVLAGGIAIGALIGAVIPRTAREKDLLAPVGRRLGETVRSATKAAREAGYAELDQRGLTRHAAKDQARSLVDGLAKALSTAGTAAAKSAGQKTDA